MLGSNGDGCADAATANTVSDSPVAPPRVLPPLCMIILGTLLMVVRGGDSVIGEWLMTYVSFEILPPHAQSHVDDLLLVPAACVLVVFCRVTLGLRMLGPFRPILIALAFYRTGVLAGATFVVFVMFAVIVLRPRLHRGMLPYFGRLSVLLSVVVMLELTALLVGAHIKSQAMLEAAVFPIVVLCLSADGFARVLTSEGLSVAAWRGTVTVALAVVISALGGVPAVSDFLYALPEFVLVEVGMIMFVSTHMNWGWLEAWGEKSPRRAVV